MSTDHQAAGHGQDSEGSAEGTGPDPSMEDILASIRRILNEEDAAPGATAEPEAAAHTEHALAPETPGSDVLELDHTMLLPDPEPASMALPAVEPVVQRAPPAVAEPAPVAPTPPLVAPEAAAAAAMSVGALMRTLASERSTQVHRGGPTIEDLVREEIRPLLKEWLDGHLAPMVERLVRAEIERVVSRTT